MTRMTIEEQERRAYAEGRTEIAGYLATIDDLQDDVCETDKLTREIEELREKVQELEDRILELS